MSPLTPRVLLISTYELGRQPFGIASPAAWLRREGCEVETLDLAVQALSRESLVRADLVALYVPMHTATRLATRLVPVIRDANPAARICFYGLYAPLNERYLRRLGAVAVLGGEFEQGIVSLVRRLQEARWGDEQREAAISLDRQSFLTPDRAGLPALDRYARLQTATGGLRTVGSTEASRGCKHHCRHCPIVPVYGGRFRIVDPQVVIDDIDQQVESGAEHITFGDPDFFNGPRHALEIIERLHRRHPSLTYDVTIKVEHLRKHGEHLPRLRETGCLFVTSAVESFDDTVLHKLRKGHTCEDVVKVVDTMRRSKLSLNPTFVAFTPWTSLESYVGFLMRILDLGLIDHLAPIQYAIRLLIPASSALLELEDVRERVEPFDDEALVHPWTHTDPRVDALQARVLETVGRSGPQSGDRRIAFRRIWEQAQQALGSRVGGAIELAALDSAPPPATVPFLTEPWYC